jgi:hypothetical protein
MMPGQTPAWPGPSAEVPIRNLVHRHQLGDFAATGAGVTPRRMQVSQIAGMPPDLASCDAADEGFIRGYCPLSTALQNLWQRRG